MAGNREAINIMDFEPGDERRTELYRRLEECKGNLKVLDPSMTSEQTHRGAMRAVLLDFFADIDNIRLKNAEPISDTEIQALQGEV